MTEQHGGQSTSSARGRLTARRVSIVVIAVAVIVALIVGAVRRNTSGSNPKPLLAGWLARENQRTGTSAWRIAANSYRAIDGYFNRVSAQRSDTINLYVSTSAPTFHVEAYRIGWYQGLGGRLVWQSGALRGEQQAAPSISRDTNTVTANWNRTLRVHIANDWPPGDYLFKLVSSAGQSYVPLTVRDDSSNAAVLFVNAVTTWQAYNDWGGYSLYFGPNMNASKRAKVVSFDRPYNWAVDPKLAPSANVVCCGFVATELGVVTALEHIGIDVAYTTDVDVEQNAGQLLHHKAVVTGGHDEYWSVAKRNAFENARDQGVNLMFLGPNPAYWRIRLESSKFGPDRLEVNYRVATDDPLYGKDNAQVTTLWRSPPPVPTRPESQLTGVLYWCFAPDNDGVVADASSWVFAGTGLKNGDHIRRLVQREADHVDRKFDTPANLQILLHSPVTCLGIGGKNVPGPQFSDTTYYTVASGAGVFATGSEWDCRLYDGCPAGPAGADPIVQKIVANVVQRFAKGPAARQAP